MRQCSRVFPRFVTVGFTGLIVNTTLLFLLYERLRLPLLIASPIAVEAAILNNFFWNNRWTFNAPPLALGRLAKFNLVSLGGLAITTSLLFILVEGFGIHYLLANLMAIAVATIWNFLLSFFWAWGPG